MIRKREEIEWLGVEIRIIYNVEERYRLEEGHGYHFLSEGEREFVRAEIYIGGKTIDISDKIKELESIL